MNVVVCNNRRRGKGALMLNNVNRLKDYMNEAPLELVGPKSFFAR